MEQLSLQLVLEIVLSDMMLLCSWYEAYVGLDECESRNYLISVHFTPSILVLSSSSVCVWY